MNYCAFCADPLTPRIHKHYHENEYGFPITSDNELFGRLILEINQAGLSWTTILNKASNIRSAYANFDIESVANFTQDDRNRLLSNPGIIRNKLKVNAIIHNAQVITSLQENFGSFKGWIDCQHPLSKDKWVKSFKKTFKFTGGEITNEFLMSSGYLKGAHVTTCPVYQKVIVQSPPWLKADELN